MMTSAPAASPAPPQVLLAHHLRQLKLPTFLREYDKVAAEAASEQVERSQKDVIDAAERELEAAQYEASLAGRRYELVDPAKRRVARELEARWNGALERRPEARGRTRTSNRRLEDEFGDAPKDRSRTPPSACARLADGVERTFSRYADQTPSHPYPDPGSRLRT
jgi:hypothetical protein